MYVRSCRVLIGSFESICTFTELCTPVNGGLMQIDNTRHVMQRQGQERRLERLVFSASYFCIKHTKNGDKAQMKFMQKKRKLHVPLFLVPTSSQTHAQLSKHSMRTSKCRNKQKLRNQNKITQNSPRQARRYNPEHRPWKSCSYTTVRRSCQSEFDRSSSWLRCCC